MASTARPIRFRDYLPEVFRGKETDFLGRFLRAFELLFEEFEAEIEGAPDGSSGGIPDLFSPRNTPPPEFTHRPGPSPERPNADFDFLNYLASWIALPLRAEKPVDWNRQFFATVLAPQEVQLGIPISLYHRRGTLPGMDALLRAWLKGDLLETDPPLLILTDLTPTHTDATAVFQLNVTATLGVDTVLGEGPPFLFITDLVTEPTLAELRNPIGLNGFQRAARVLLDGEKPAHTYYQLRVRAHTMQLPAPGETTIAGHPGAQIGETTLLWDEPWVFDSDC